MKRQGDENLNRSESKYFNTAVRMDEALIELLETQEFSYISVKSICEKAGVNRSTFYLHYENTSDLLAETLQYILDSFTSCFQTDAKSTIEKIQDAPIDKLHFLTEDYLVPYLEYIKKNRRIYQAAFENKAYETDKNTAAHIHTFWNRYWEDLDLQKRIGNMYQHFIFVELPEL